MQNDPSSPAQSHSIPPHGTEHCRHTVSIVANVTISLISLIFYFYQILFNYKAAICIKNKNKQWGMGDNVTKMSVARLLIHIERLAV